MGRVERNLLRRKLEKLLARSLEEPLIELIATFVAAQEGNAAAASRIKDMPPEAINAKIGEKYHIPMWTIETLLNEIICTEKDKRENKGRKRILRSDNYYVISMLSNIILKIENAEDSIFLEKNDVFDEMARLVQRQFPWQRQIENIAHLYRSIILYGSGSAADYFQKKNGISVSDFIKFGFVLMGYFTKNVTMHSKRKMSSVGLSSETCESALKKYAINHKDAQVRYSELRKNTTQTAYRPSFLRDFPLIAFGKAGERLHAPIPELIWMRFTSGLYLDVVSGGSAVWTQIGQRFEKYCLDYLSSMMAPYTVRGEISYGSKKSGYKSPDVLISLNGEIVAVAECKAKRMSFNARYAADPITKAATGFNEISQGIFQIWRFFAHVRQGKLEKFEVSPDCQGILLLADSWLTMAPNQASQVFEEAHKLADKYGGITIEDRRGIAVCQIDDVEIVLQNQDPEQFLNACREIAEGEKKYWMLSVARKTENPNNKPYPFENNIADIIPWWDKKDI